MKDWRFYVLIVIFVMSIIDISLTYYYVNKYKKWQPEKPYKLIELNPILVFLWNNTNLIIGTLVSGVIFLTLDYIIVKDAHWLVVLLLLSFLVFALYNHHNNITLLNKLIEQYPSGYLPESIFGFVEGNNLIKQGEVK